MPRRASSLLVALIAVLLVSAGVRADEFTDTRTRDDEYVRRQQEFANDVAKRRRETGENHVASPHPEQNASNLDLSADHRGGTSRAKSSGKPGSKYDFDERHYQWYASPHTYVPQCKPSESPSHYFARLSSECVPAFGSRRVYLAKKSQRFIGWGIGVHCFPRQRYPYGADMEHEITSAAVIFASNEETCRVINGQVRYPEE